MCVFLHIFMMLIFCIDFFCVPVLFWYLFSVIIYHLYHFVICEVLGFLLIFLTEHKYISPVNNKKALLIECS